MSRWPEQLDPRRVVFVQPRKPRKRYRFRWGLIWVPCVILAAAWLLQNVECNASWDKVMDSLEVENRQRYTQVACWGVALCGIAAIVRICRNDHDKE